MRIVGLCEGQNNFDRHILEGRTTDYGRLQYPSEIGEDLSYPFRVAPLSLEKPWGLETLLGRNGDFEVWELKMAAGTTTSYHAHPNKEQLYFVICGRAFFESENGYEMLMPGDFRLVCSGVPHRNGPLCQELMALEIETPPDKNRIIRFNDLYGRAGMPFLHGSHLLSRGEPESYRGSGAPLRYLSSGFRTLSGDEGSESLHFLVSVNEIYQLGLDSCGVKELFIDGLGDFCSGYGEASSMTILNPEGRKTVILVLSGNIIVYMSKLEECVTLVSGDIISFSDPLHIAAATKAICLSVTS
jgi:mannose-6-phosphate isomerase-like protein (cupin superfamily)